jgi:hypothetical protein
MTSQIANEKLYLKRGRRSGIMKELAGHLKIMEKHKSKREKPENTPAPSLAP